MGGFATLPLPFGGSPSREQNKKGTTCGRLGYITPAVWGVPNKGTESEMPHTWADWLHQPRRLGGPQQGDKIRTSPCVGGLATPPLPSGGVPNKRKNQKGTTSERIGYIALAVWGVPSKGAKSGMAYITPAVWVSPTRGQIRNGLHVGGLATSPLPYGGSPTRGQKS